jgi:hypothetical protein
MNNWCFCWFFMHIFTARRLYKSFGVKGLNFMKVLLVGTELWAGGQTDAMKVIVAFRNLAKAPKISILCSYTCDT